MENIHGWQLMETQFQKMAELPEYNIAFHVLVSVKMISFQ